MPASLLEPRFDVLMLIVSNEMHLQEVRSELDREPGLSVREFIAPSGLMVQGTPDALQHAEMHPGIAPPATPFRWRCFFTATLST